MRWANRLVTGIGVLFVAKIWVGGNVAPRCHQPVDNVAEVALVWGSCSTRRIFLETIEGERKGESAAGRNAP